MRLALVPPSKLTSEQLPLYEDMKAGISAKYGAFTTMRDDGTILGPWSADLRRREPTVEPGALVERRANAERAGGSKASRNSGTSPRSSGMGCCRI
jgi:hypothetical protein